MFSIAAVTFREILNKKIFIAIIILSIICYGLYGTAVYFLNSGSGAYSPQNALIKPVTMSVFFSIGLFFSTFAVSLVAVLMPVASISGDIENGTMQAIVPQPIKRYEIVLGKFFGYSLMVLVYSSVVYLLVMFINQGITGYMPASVWPGLLYFNLVGQVLVAVTILGSTLMSTLANGISVILLFLIALIGGMTEQIANMAGSASTFANVKILSNIGIVTSLIIPSDAMFRKTVAAVVTVPNLPLDFMSANPFGAVRPPSTIMVIYTFIYIAAILFLAVKIFNRKDI